MPSNKLLDFKLEDTLTVANSAVANSNYCPLVWTLSSASSLEKIKNLQRIALLFWCNDSKTSYEELLSKSSTSLMNVKRLRTLCLELYKNINKLSLTLWKTSFNYDSPIGLSLKKIKQIWLSLSLTRFRMGRRG